MLVIFKMIPIPLLHITSYVPLTLLQPTCLQSESNLVTNILSFPSTSLQILHLTVCKLPFEPKQNSTQGSFVAQQSWNFLKTSFFFELSA
jgi:hypothetical protein